MTLEPLLGMTLEPLPPSAVSAPPRRSAAAARPVTLEPLLAMTLEPLLGMTSEPLQASPVPSMAPTSSRREMTLEPFRRGMTSEPLPVNRPPRRTGGGTGSSVMPPDGSNPLGRTCRV